MNAEKTLSRMLNDEFESEVLKEALRFVEYDEDITRKLIRDAADRLNNEWVRKSNKWTNEIIHKPSSSLF
jgi:hypothetical protein